MMFPSLGESHFFPILQPRCSVLIASILPISAFVSILFARPYFLFPDSLPLGLPFFFFASQTVLKMLFCFLGGPSRRSAPFFGKVDFPLSQSVVSLHFFNLTYFPLPLSDSQ